MIKIYLRISINWWLLPQTNSQTKTKKAGKIHRLHVNQERVRSIKVFLWTQEQNTGLLLVQTFFRPMGSWKPFAFVCRSHTVLWHNRERGARKERLGWGWWWYTRCAPLGKACRWEWTQKTGMKEVGRWKQKGREVEGKKKKKTVEISARVTVENPFVSVTSHFYTAPEKVDVRLLTKSRNITRPWDIPSGILEIVWRGKKKKWLFPTPFLGSTVAFDQLGQTVQIHRIKVICYLTSFDFREELIGSANTIVYGNIWRPKVPK